MGRDEIIFGIGMFVLGLVGNYLVNYTSNPLALRFRSWRERNRQLAATKSVEKARRRKAQLQADLDEIEDYYSNSSAFIAFGLKTLAGYVLSLIMGSTMAIISAIALVPELLSLSTPRGPGTLFFALGIVAGTAFIVFGAAGAVSAMGKWSKVEHFAALKANTGQQIAELERVISGEEKTGQS